MSLTAPEQPAQGQDPQVTPDPTPAAAPPAAAPVAPSPASGSGPWANDLNQTFADEAVRGQVDEFLRSKVQPYTTQLEQKAAQNQEAQRLHQAFADNPIDAYVQVTNELFGEEAAQVLLADIQKQLDQPAPTPEPGQPQAAPVDPRVQSLLDWAEQKQINEHYETQIERVSAEHPEIDVDLFHPFVAAASGDFDQAYGMYSTWLAEYGQKYGAAPEVTPATPPPAVLGSDTGAAQPSNTPVEPKNQTIGEAIEDFVRESRLSVAPPVGSA